MIASPAAVAFDVVETVFSVEPLRLALKRLGLSDHALEIWFAASLRDAFALAATGSFQPFRAVLNSSLHNLLLANGLPSMDDERAQVLKSMLSLPAQPGAEEAFRHIAGLGIAVLVVSNGAPGAIRAMLDANGLLPHVTGIVSVNDVKAGKPRAEVYHYAAAQAGLSPEEVAMVSCHPWDVHGAKRAGLKAGFVARGLPYPTIMEPPDWTADTIVEVAHKITGG